MVSQTNMLLVISVLVLVGTVTGQVIRSTADDDVSPADLRGIIFYLNNGGEHDLLWMRKPKVLCIKRKNFTFCTQLEDL